MFRQGLIAAKGCLRLSASLVWYVQIESLRGQTFLISLGLTKAEIRIYSPAFITFIIHRIWPFAMAVHSNTDKAVDLPSPPFVSVSGIYNFRDLGGYTVSPGLSVKRNVIYRCGEPS